MPQNGNAPCSPRRKTKPWRLATGPRSILARLVEHDYKVCQPEADVNGQQCHFWQYCCTQMVPQHCWGVQLHQRVRSHRERAFPCIWVGLLQWRFLWHKALDNHIQDPIISSELGFCFRRWRSDWTGWWDHNVQGYCSRTLSWQWNHALERGFTPRRWFCSAYPRHSWRTSTRSRWQFLHDSCVWDQWRYNLWGCYIASNFGACLQFWSWPPCQCPDRFPDPILGTQYTPTPGGGRSGWRRRRRPRHHGQFILHWSWDTQISWWAENLAFWPWLWRMGSWCTFHMGRHGGQSGALGHCHCSSWATTYPISRHGGYGHCAPTSTTRQGSVPHHCGAHHGSSYHLSTFCPFDWSSSSTCKSTSVSWSGSHLLATRGTGSWTMHYPHWSPTSTCRSRYCHTSWIEPACANSVHSFHWGGWTKSMQKSSTISTTKIRTQLGPTGQSRRSTWRWPPIACGWNTWSWRCHLFYGQTTGQIIQTSTHWNLIFLYITWDDLVSW